MRHVRCWKRVDWIHTGRSGVGLENLLQAIRSWCYRRWVVVVGSRMAEWLKATWNRTEFVLLPPKYELARLYLLSIHNKDHCGIDATLANARKFWIPRVRRLIRAIRKRCVTCRKKQKIIQRQTMGVLPLDRLLPSPAFNYTAMDLFGLCTNRDAVRKNTQWKGIWSDFYFSDIKRSIIIFGFSWQLLHG